MLFQYLWEGREVCCRELFGSADMLHVCGALLMFVHGYWFFNYRKDPAQPARSMSFWKTLQDDGNVGENIATTEGRITSLENTNVRQKEVTTAMRTKLAVVGGILTTETETETHAFALHSMFGEVCPVVEAILPLVNWINRNRTDWVWIMV